MILYFSGTGNSGYAARRIADGLGEPLLCLNDRIKAGNTAPVETGERLVIVTPTYAWRIPRIVEDWLLHTELTGAKRAWFVMTCGSEIGDANRYNRRLCQAKGLVCMGTAQIVMPENYIAMFNAPQAEEARQIVARAEPDIDNVIAAVRENRAFPPPRRKFYDRFMSGPVNPIFYSCFVKANAFTTGNACTGCGQCVRRCLIHCGTPASHRRRDAKGMPFVASRLFSLERFRPVTGRTQRGIARDAIPVEAYEHTAVIRQAFVQDPSGYAVADHIQADTTALQIQLHPVFFTRRRRKDKWPAFFDFPARDVCGRILLQQIPYRVCKGNALHTDKIVQRAFPANVPAFPVPQAGALADLEAVMAAQLVFARTAAHQFFRPVPLQKLYRRHLFCLPELFLFKVQFFTPPVPTKRRPVITHKPPVVFSLNIYM